MIQARRGVFDGHPWLPATLSLLNVVASVASGAFGAVAVARPGALLGGPVARSRATSFFAEMYAARALVFAAVGVAASASIRRHPVAAAGVLAAEGATQAADLLIAARHRTPGIVGSAVGTAVAGGSALTIALVSRQSRIRKTSAPRPPSAAR